jgi:FtsH-binding integral membrane protein
MAAPETTSAKVSLALALATLATGLFAMIVATSSEVPEPQLLNRILFWWVVGIILTTAVASRSYQTTRTSKLPRLALKLTWYPILILIGVSLILLWSKEHRTEQALPWKHGRVLICSDHVISGPVFE